jgi:Ca-activated chloride channel family protein
MSSVKLSTALEYDKVSFGKSHIVHLLINLEGTKLDPGKRQPVALGSALDCSGSMADDQGKKMEYAKKSLQQLVKHLSETDRFGAVGFSGNVWEIFPFSKMGQDAKDKAHQAIEKEHPQASTNISGAMLSTFDLLKKGDSKISRAMLFTDGMPTSGDISRDGLLKGVAQRPQGTSFSTFGYGTDCDRELLQSMAKQGSGNFYFIKTPDECLKAFAHELGGLLSCVGQNIKVTFKTKADVKILEVLNDLDVDANQDQTEATIKVDDIYSEEKRKLLVKLEIPSMRDFHRPFKLGDVEITYMDLKANEPRSAETSLKIEYVKEADAQKEQHVEVREQIAIHQAAKAQEEAIKLADVGDYIGAQRILKDAADDCRVIGTAFACAVADDLQGPVSKSLSSEEEKTSGGIFYAASNASSYSRGRASTGGTADLYANKMQKEVTASFTGKDPVPSMPYLQITPVEPAKPVKPPMMANEPKKETVAKRRKKKE